MPGCISREDLPRDRSLIGIQLVGLIGTGSEPVRKETTDHLVLLRGLQLSTGDVLGQLQGVLFRKALKD